MKLKNSTKAWLAGGAGLLLLIGAVLLFVVSANRRIEIAPTTAPVANNVTEVTPTVADNRVTESAPTMAVVPTATPEVTATPPPTETAVVIPTPNPQPPTPTAAPDKDDVIAWGLVGEPPTSGKWIDFNLSDGYTRLMDNRKLVKALPSAWGYGETGTETDWYSTAPGTYSVYQRTAYLWYDWQYSQKWIKGFIGFDPERANGFHSFLLDSKGNVVDSNLGPVTHGCIRLEDWKAVYDFSAIGMPVVVHGQTKKTPIAANK